jgi:hypothetical protein
MPLDTIAHLDSLSPDQTIALEEKLFDDTRNLWLGGFQAGAAGSSELSPSP